MGYPHHKTILLRSFLQKLTGMGDTNEVKTESLEGDRRQSAFFQLGTYVREVFATQVHRRCTALSPDRVHGRIPLWDRAGVLSPSVIDYHRPEEQSYTLCTAAGLVTWDDQARIRSYGILRQCSRLPGLAIFTPHCHSG